MKRPLTTADYERMTFNAVYAKYGETGSFDLYNAMCMQSWQSFRMNGFPAPDRMIRYKRHALAEMYRHEHPYPHYTVIMAHMIRDEPKTYRISLNDKGGVEVVCFDLEKVDSELEGYYDEVSDLPTWVQERIAVLAVCSPEPPTPTVEGIGRRISENVYWVYNPNDN